MTLSGDIAAPTTAQTDSMNVLNPVTASNRLASRQVVNQQVRPPQQSIQPKILESGKAEVNTVSAAKPSIKLRKLNSTNEIDTDCKVRFKIDQQLAKFLSIDEWSTFKEVTIGMLRYNKVVGDFYDRTTSTFNAFKYPIFSRFFPDQAKISSEDLKKYLLKRQ